MKIQHRLTAMLLIFLYGVTAGGAFAQESVVREGALTPGKISMSFDSAPLTEICLLGDIAQRVDTRIQWDAAGGKVTNLPEANKYIRGEYRNGWAL